MYPLKENKFLALDELTPDAEDGFTDRNVLWTTLETRLRAGRRKKRSAWYRVAACLVIIISVAVLLKSKPIEMEQESEPITLRVDTGSAEDENLLLIPPAKTAIPIQTGTDKITTRAVLPAKDLTISRSPSDSSIETTKAAVAFVSDLKPDDTLAPLIVTTKIKIPVVHLNDLVEEDNLAARNFIAARKARRNKDLPKQEYAGIFNLRIYLKNQ